MNAAPAAVTSRPVNDLPSVSVGVAGLRRSSVSVGGFSILGYARNRPGVVATEIANALDLVATGKLKITPTVQRLTDAPGAHATALAHASSGKVVFEIHKPR